ncbi:hypothetical protein [endosymbiont GvMRE of Glomus versiforme]|uniref:hypothetical protein n=1 Tax=endosymbiont GvMRE of Glomus versiforme TaxID=2039283 RepID=UPI000ECF6981|nr:hypothetical protein [endosymbiont GvMRE of Glomus versiforme]RHZ37490.1 hypothetical protein GvMRE_I1g562 [endosymbiont GvMRE of Glomus versiforme]
MNKLLELSDYTKTIKELKAEKSELVRKTTNLSFSNIAFYTQEIEKWENELKFFQEKVKTEEFRLQSTEFKKKYLLLWLIWLKW